MTDFSVKFTIRNARILRAIKAAGYETYSQIAYDCGVPVQYISGFVTFRVTPLSHGEWSEYAMLFAAALHCDPEELWPDHIKHLKAGKRHVEVEMSADEVMALPNDAPYIDRKALDKLLLDLPSRVHRVLALRYGLGGEPEMTLDEVAKEFKVTKERIRQIEQKGVRLIRDKIYKKKIDVRPDYT